MAVMNHIKKVKRANNKKHVENMGDAYFIDRHNVTPAEAKEALMVEPKNKTLLEKAAGIVSGAKTNEQIINDQLDELTPDQLIERWRLAHIK